MEEKKYIVYMHIFPNNKVYIGITTQSVKKRWNNGNGYRNNQYMTNAIKKYGWENVEHKILYVDLPSERAEKIERKLILKYNSNNKKYGYNILKGGNVSKGVTEETKKKMSINTKKLWQDKKYRNHMIEVHSGKKASQETKEKISRNNARIWTGKHLSEETKKKISNAKKGKVPWNKGTKGVMKANKTSFKKGQPSVNRKKVKCIETRIEYNSLLEASIETKINQTCIMNVCKHKQKTAGGYHWKYI